MKASYKVVDSLVRVLKFWVNRQDEEETYRYGAALGRLLMRIATSRVRITDENISCALPEMTEKVEVADLRRRVFENLARTFFEILRLGQYNSALRKQMINLTNEDVVHHWAKSGRGVIFNTAHFGNWEMLGSWLSANNYPTSFLAGVQTNPYFDKLLNELRASVGVNIIPTGSSPRRIMSALKRGEFIGMVTDQHSAIGHEVVKFFGRDVAAHRGAGLFAYRTGAVILTAFMRRVGPGKHEAWVEEPILADRSKPEAEEVHRITVQIMQYFESAIRRYPDQWMWTHRRWKPVPLAETID